MRIFGIDAVELPISVFCEVRQVGPAAVCLVFSYWLWYRELSFDLKQFFKLL